MLGTHTALQNPPALQGWVAYVLYAVHAAYSTACKELMVPITRMLEEWNLCRPGLVPQLSHTPQQLHAEQAAFQGVSFCSVHAFP